MNRSIKQQKFAEAITELEQAYKLDPQTEHLYNLGIAHHLSGDDSTKERKVQVLDDEIKVNEADIQAQEKRRTVELAKAELTTKQAKKWEIYARQAPSGEGRGQRIAGAIFLGAGAAGVTMGAHDFFTRSSTTTFTDHAQLYLLAGTASLIVGLICASSGASASTNPRSSGTFVGMQLAPTIGPEGGGVSLSARF